MKWERKGNKGKQVGQQAARYLQQAVDQLIAWYSKWRVTINASKSQTIVFTPSARESGEIIVGHEEDLWQHTVPWRHH
jgi:hypothetical protein